MTRAMIGGVVCVERGTKKRGVLDAAGENRAAPSRPPENGASGRARRRIARERREVERARRRVR
eukprot:31490-Pelagococcus_subviridis.AAC.22